MKTEAHHERQDREVWENIVSRIRRGVGSSLVARLPTPPLPPLPPPLPPTIFAPKPSAEWLADPDDVTSSTDDHFAAGMKCESVRYEAVEQARCAGASRVQSPPPQPQPEAEVDGDDDDLGDWPPTPEWDPGQMQLAITADIAATTTASAAIASTTDFLYCICSGCRRVLCSPQQGPAPAPTDGARRATLLTRSLSSRFTFQ